MVACERVDTLACGDRLDADDCEDKKKERKRKEKLTRHLALHMDGSGCRCWWNVDAVVVAQLMTQHV